MRAIPLSAAAAVVAIALPACAQEVASDQVAPLSVIARLPSLADDQPGAYVISAGEIAQRQTNTAYDLLQTVPGLDLYRTGAFGGVTTIRQRGMTNDKSLVLVDGVPQDDASQPSGGYDFAHLSLDEVSQVEVLNGPQGSLWGSDAIGGVIAFTTRSPDGLHARAEGGSFGSSDFAADFGKTTGTWSAGAFARASHSDGVSAADQRFGNSEKDGDDNTSLGARGGVTLNGVSLDGRVEYDRAKTDFDGFPPPFYLTLGDTDDVARTQSWDGYGRAKVQAFGLDHTLLIGASTLTRDYAGESGDYGYKAANRVYRYTAEHGAADSPLAYSVGIEREETRATLSSGSTDLSANSAFAVARLKHGPLGITGSLRYDDPARYRGVATAKLAGTLDLPAGWRLLASVGQGFKTPSLSQTVCDFCSSAALSLKPERAIGYDGAAVWRSADQRWGVDLDAYRLQVKNQITFVGGHYVNINRARTNGLEVSGQAALGAGLGLKLAYSWTDAVDDSTGKALIRVPKTTASAVLSYARGKVSSALTVRGESSQADTDLDGFSAIRRKGFVVADIAGAYALTPQVSLTARVQNLTDKTYEELYGYGEPGRAFYAGLRLKL